MEEMKEEMVGCWKDIEGRDDGVMRGDGRVVRGWREGKESGAEGLRGSVLVSLKRD